METPEQMQAEWAEAITRAGVATEAQMRESKAPTLDSLEELSAYINSLVDRPHDYGTCVYAMSLAATATFNYVARKLGVTGFQASCADMDILRQTRDWQWGRILNYENLLYPQYLNDKHFPSWDTLLRTHRVRLARRAKELLEKTPDAAVADHWRAIISSVSPEELAAEEKS